MHLQASICPLHWSHTYRKALQRLVWFSAKFVSTLISLIETFLLSLCFQTLWEGCWFQRVHFSTQHHSASGVVLGRPRALSYQYLACQGPSWCRQLAVGSNHWRQSSACGLQSRLQTVPWRFASHCKQGYSWWSLHGQTLLWPTIHSQYVC